ncbi:MAG: acyl-CoA dehydrogenase [Anaerolineae bacterium]|nr:acyl-CoA dehydrogenase [Anaerolineae bacterium]
MDFELTEEQRLIRNGVREFAQGEIAPRAREIDETGEFPWDILKKMAKLGLMGLPFPEKYGGAGADTLSCILAIEEIAAASGSVAITYNAHLSLGAAPIYMFGTEAQKQKWLAPLARGEALGAFALTEPHAGSDSAAMKTRAEDCGNEWVLNGQKMWITSGSVAHSFVVAAKTDPAAGAHGVSNFIVPADAPGLVVGKDEPKMGMKGSPTNQLFFQDCRLPKENLLGRLNEGFKQFMLVLDAARITISAMALGLGRAALEQSIKYAQEREAFGQPIAGFQSIQMKLADMATELEAARLLMHKAAVMKERGERITQIAAMAKVFATEAADRACWQAIQIHGGMGYSRELPVERFYRDNRLTLIGDGTSEIQRLLIARHLLKEA